jgi:transcriptional regulator with XRE-family HTH domain
MRRDVFERRVTIDSIGRKRTWPSLADRLAARVDSSAGPDACWPWTAALTTTGYGSFGGNSGGAAHRVAYVVANGPIPDGLGVLHRCDNRQCCNPAHLFVGSQYDNMRDMAAKGRTGRITGERSVRAKLTDAQVDEIRGRRQAGATLKSLAAEYGVTSAHLSHVMSGRRRPPVRPWAPVPPPAPRLAPSGPARVGLPLPKLREVIAAAKHNQAVDRRQRQEAVRAQAQRLYEMGLSMAEVAARMECDPSSISRYLKHRKSPSRPASSYVAARKRRHDLRRRLLARSLINPGTNCWEWVGCKDQWGYGLIKRDGVMWRAHRAIYELWFGPIPEGLEIDHLCCVRHCLNPDHLEVVTGAENIRRMVTRLSDRRAS